MSRFAPPCARNSAAVGSLIATGSPSHAAGTFTGIGSASCFASARLFASAADVFPLNTSGAGQRSPARLWMSSSTCSRFSSASHTTWNGSFPSTRPFWSL